MGISFANSHLLWMIPAALVLGYVAHLLGRTQQKKLSNWVKRPLWNHVIPEYSDKIFVTKNILLTLGLFFLAISICRPQWGEREEFIQSNGMDVLFLMDLSNSMLAEDVTPSRLNRTQTFIKKTLDLLADDRVGVVGFAGSAYLAAPLTTDFGYVAEIVDSLDPSSISNQGTDIGVAIDVGMKAFERGGEDNHNTSRAFVLISDGEDFGPEATQAAEKLKTFGAGFFVLSVGLTEGAPIPLRNDTGILQTYKKDTAGKPVLSRVNKDHLSKIATAGGGKFIELVNADDAAFTLSRQLLSFGRDSNKEQRQVTKIDRYSIFLALAILFFMIHLSLGYRKKAFLALLLIGFMQFISTPSSAQTFESYLNSKKAKALYEKQDFENAGSAYESSRKDDPENSSLQFNQGTAMAKAKKNEDAVAQFQEATKKSLATGDYETAAKSLYNEGLTLGEMKNISESYNRLSKAIEMAKISKQPELEQKAREAMAQFAEKQKQQQQDEKDGKEKKEDKKEGESQKKKPGEGESKDKKEGDGDENKDSKNKKEQPKPEDGKKRQFKSGTLSKDVAESVMNDLSDREKQLYRKRMKERKTREVQNDKDW